MRINYPNINIGIGYLHTSMLAIVRPIGEITGRSVRGQMRNAVETFGATTAGIQPRRPVRLCLRRIGRSGFAFPL